MSGTNALLPTQNPQTRFGGPTAPPIGLTGPRMPANALQVPPATQPPAGALPPVQPPPAPPVAPPTDAGGRISARVPVPATDFHPDHHDELHKVMGPEFDKPEASKFVREAYDGARDAHPHVDAKAALLTARDAWHAVQHGLATHEQAHHAVRTFPALFGGRQ